MVSKVFKKIDLVLLEILGITGNDSLKKELLSKILKKKPLNSKLAEKKLSGRRTACAKSLWPEFR